VELLEPAVRAACDRGLAVELNSSYVWDLPGWLDLLCRYDAQVALSSDAHRAADVGSNLRFLEQHLPSPRRLDPPLEHAA